MTIEESLSIVTPPEIIDLQTLGDVVDLRVGPVKDLPEEASWENDDVELSRAPDGVYYAAVTPVVDPEGRSITLRLLTLQLLSYPIQFAMS